MSRPCASGWKTSGPTPSSWPTTRDCSLPSACGAGAGRAEQGRALAVLGLPIRPDDQCTRILRVAHCGQTGQTYAFDRSGLTLSQSRFDEDLKRMGLLEDRPDVRSILTL